MAVIGEIMIGVDDENEEERINGGGKFGMVGLIEFL